MSQKFINPNNSVNWSYVSVQPVHFSPFPPPLCYDVLVGNATTLINDPFKKKLRVDFWKGLPRHTYLLAVKHHGIVLKMFGTTMLFFKPASLELKETCLLATDELFIWKAIAVIWTSRKSTAGCINLCLLVRTIQYSVCECFYFFPSWFQMKYALIRMLGVCDSGALRDCLSVISGNCLQRW